MNNEEKLNFVKEEITGLNYLNSILTDALFYYQETEGLNPQFIYLNSLMEDKFSKILNVLQASTIDNR